MIAKIKQFADSIAFTVNERINIAAPIVPQFLIMGVTILVLDFVIYSDCAGLGAKISRRGGSSQLARAINKVAGGALLLSAFRIAKVSA